MVTRSGDENEVRSVNVNACLAVANVIRTSYGPFGLDKMLCLTYDEQSKHPDQDMNDRKQDQSFSRVIVSSDGATILKSMLVQHPAARVMVQLALAQKQEVGDGASGVVLLASELLYRGQALVLVTGIHPSVVISGFRRAQREAVKFLKNSLALSSATDTSKLADVVLSAAQTALSSKVFSVPEECQFFAKIAVDAVITTQVVKPLDKNDVPVGHRYNKKHIHVLKFVGKSITESALVHGYILNYPRASPAMRVRVAPAKIAFLDFSLQPRGLNGNIRVECSDPAKLGDIAKAELLILHKQVMSILKSGANVCSETASRP